MIDNKTEKKTEIEDTWAFVGVGLEGALYESLGCGHISKFINFITTDGLLWSFMLVLSLLVSFSNISNFQDKSP